MKCCITKMNLRFFSYFPLLQTEPFLYYPTQMVVYFKLYSMSAFIEHFIIIKALSYHPATRSWLNSYILKEAKPKPNSKTNHHYYPPSKSLLKYAFCLSFPFISLLPSFFNLVTFISEPITYVCGVCHMFMFMCAQCVVSVYSVCM
jgi:hypothetical protein